MESSDKKCIHVHANTHVLPHQTPCIVSREQEADLQGRPGNLLCPKIKLRVQYMERSKGQETQLSVCTSYAVATENLWCEVSVLLFNSK